MCVAGEDKDEETKNVLTIFFFLGRKNKKIADQFVFTAPKEGEDQDANTLKSVSLYIPCIVYNNTHTLHQFFQT